MDLPHSFLLNSLGERIKSLRKSHGLRQSELASRSKVSLRHIQAIEAGQSDVKLSTVASVAEALQVERCYLMSRIFDLEQGRTGQIVCRMPCYSPLEEFSAGLQVCDKDGLIVYANSHCLDVMGYYPEEILGKVHIWDLIYDCEEVPGLQKYIKFLVKEKPKPTPYMSFNRCKNGQKIPVQVNWSYIYDRQQEVMGFCSSIFYGTPEGDVDTDVDNGGTGFI